MKLIMENWRRFLAESPLYDYEPEKFGPLSLYHEDNGDNGELVLYHMMPSIVDNGMYIVGYISTTRHKNLVFQKPIKLVEFMSRTGKSKRIFQNAL